MQTKTLSQFLAKYIRDHLFNGRGIEKAETFEGQLIRILHEGIFTYRKHLSSSAKTIERGSPAFKICNALIDCEDESVEL